MIRFVSDGARQRRPTRNPAGVEQRCRRPQSDTTESAGRHDRHQEATRKEAAVDKDEHFKLLRASSAKVDGLLAELQSIRDQEAALQAQRVKKHEELKQARDERMKLMTAAIDDKVPKAQVARALGMDRTNLYKLLEGKDDSAEA
ncbi:hypothetical protein [Kibdelosporangium philippinense]|uniref:hypothetical protein n=1 Tax=Kibdelosporangium philippinense TaxID=211113 RepID=UPI00360B6D2F